MTIDLFQKHIELIDAVNSSDTEVDHVITQARLRGFRDALDIQNINQLCECDNYYIERGYTRPMCCGVFLDWYPSSFYRTTRY
jgi:hypothetical protein